jgi:ABC-type phosphate/phosphonate transport system substrate-binding protein
MTSRIAALPMYDADRAAVQAWWHGVAELLRAQGLDGVPAQAVWPQDLHAHWLDPRLLLSQSCGHPLVTTLAGRVQVVGAFRYSAPGCEGLNYSSEIVVRSDDAEAIEAYRGRVAAVNAHDSHSGAYALRAHVALHAVNGAFFGRYRVTGSHRRSLDAVRSGDADLAAIDNITLAGLQRAAPDCLRGLKVIASTEAVTGLPLITAAATLPSDVIALRRALASACAAPALADARSALFIAGFEPVDATAWRRVDELRRIADDALYAERQEAVTRSE